jgi:hypothetical protein
VNALVKFYLWINPIPLGAAAQLPVLVSLRQVLSCGLQWPVEFVAVSGLAEDPLQANAARLRNLMFSITDENPANVYSPQIDCPADSVRMLQLLDSSASPTALPSEVQEIPVGVLFYIKVRVPFIDGSGRRTAYDEKDVARLQSAVALLAARLQGSFGRSLFRIIRDAIDDADHMASAPPNINDFVIADATAALPSPSPTFSVSPSLTGSITPTPRVVKGRGADDGEIGAMVGAVFGSLTIILVGAAVYHRYASRKRKLKALTRTADKQKTLFEGEDGDDKGSYGYDRQPADNASFVYESKEIYNPSLTSTFSRDKGRQTLGYQSPNPFRPRIGVDASSDSEPLAVTKRASALVQTPDGRIREVPLVDVEDIDSITASSSPMNLSRRLNAVTVVPNTPPPVSFSATKKSGATPDGRSPGGDRAINVGSGDEESAPEKLPGGTPGRDPFAIKAKAFSSIAYEHDSDDGRLDGLPYGLFPSYGQSAFSSTSSVSSDMLNSRVRQGAAKLMSHQAPPSGRKSNFHPVQALSLDGRMVNPMHIGLDGPNGRTPNFSKTRAYGSVLSAADFGSTIPADAPPSGSSFSIPKSPDASASTTRGATSSTRPGGPSSAGSAAAAFMEAFNRSVKRPSQTTNGSGYNNTSAGLDVDADDADRVPELDSVQRRRPSQGSTARRHSLSAALTMGATSTSSLTGQNKNALPRLYFSRFLGVQPERPGLVVVEAGKDSVAPQTRPTPVGAAALTNTAAISLPPPPAKNSGTVGGRNPFFKKKFFN